MRNRFDTFFAFSAVLTLPVVASADTGSALVAAGNGPWIALAVIGMVRALLCLGHGDSSQGDDRVF